MCVMCYPLAASQMQLWKTVVSASGAPHVQFLASLSHHANAVNIVRFSPSGKELTIRCCHDYVVPSGVALR